MAIYSAVTGKSFDDITAEFVRTGFAKLIEDKAYLKECYTAGAEAAFKMTRKTLSKVYRKVGFVDAR